MKRKVRKLVVNGEDYAWRVCKPNCDGDGGCQLRVFRGKKLIINELFNPNKLTLTPALIVQKIFIQAILAQ